MPEISFFLTSNKTDSRTLTRSFPATHGETSAVVISLQLGRPEALLLVSLRLCPRISMALLPKWHNWTHRRRILGKKCNYWFL